MKLLLVEDQVDLNQSLTKRLKAENYTVDSVFNGVEALDYLAVNDYDLIICDIMMPKLDGYQVLKALKKAEQRPQFIFLTAKDSLDNRIEGLDLGADDYLVKPFAFEELLARIRVQIRQKYNQGDSVLRRGHLELDLSKKTLTFHNQNISLTAKEYQVLQYLLQNLDHILSRDQILNQVWNLDYEGESNIIDVIIKNIRKKLAAVSEEPVITTKRGLGYVIQSL